MAGLESSTPSVCFISSNCSRVMMAELGKWFLRDYLPLSHVYASVTDIGALGILVQDVPTAHPLNRMQMTDMAAPQTEIPRRGAARNTCTHRTPCPPRSGGGALGGVRCDTV